MDPTERKLRAFGAAFFVSLGFKNWVRTRAREKQLQGVDFEIVLVWGRRRFRVGNLPTEEPYFALELADGTLEKSPHL